MRTKVKDDISREHILEVLESAAEDHGVKLDRDSLSAIDQTFRGRLVGFKYDFEIKISDGHFLVEEQISTSIVWHLLWMLPLVFFGSYTIFSFKLTPVSLVLSLLSIVMVLLWVTCAERQKSLLLSGRGEFRDLEQFHTVYIFTPLISSILLVGCFMSNSSGYESLNGLFFSVLLVTVALNFILLVFDRFFSVFRFEYSFSQSNPRQITPLIFAVTASGLMIGYFAFGPDIIINLQNQMSLYILVGVLSQRIAIFLTSALVLWVLVIYIKMEGVNDYFDFIEDYRTAGSRKAQFLAIGFFPVLFYTLTYAAVRVLQRYILPNLVHDPLLAAAMLTSIFPVLYFPAGIFYQTIAHFSKIYRLFRNSNSESDVCSPQAEIRSWKTKDSSYQAASISTGFKNYIFVTEDALNDLDKPLIQAVIAHEEAHIRNGEAFLSFYIPILSLITLTGRNIFYSFVNYRHRELQADKRAADIVSEEVVIASLERFGGNPGDPKTTTSLLPLSGYSNGDGLHNYFDLFFGNYAIRKAHPSIEERIDNLECELPLP